jgi:hypothetical protein
MDVHSLDGQLAELKSKKTIYGAGWWAGISAQLFTDGLHYSGFIQFYNGNPPLSVVGRSRQEVQELCHHAAEKAAGNK